MNVYDFDKTIYKNDSSVDFIIFLYTRKPYLLFTRGLQTLFFAILYGLKIIPKESAKVNFFAILKNFDNKEDMVKEFWDKHQNGIKDFYYKNKKEDDLIISASPYFLISEICNRLNVKCMATPLDLQTVRYQGKNCHGKEKVQRFYELYPNGRIEEFYSDSYHDQPLAEIAKEAYMVKGNQISKWKFK